jgi:glycosyltransferase involved in cell wall biosynthesis
MMQCRDVDPDEAGRNLMGMESAQPLVSVIITVYNGARYLKDAIESVLDQTYPRLECIVVDDGSTDDSPLIIESFGFRIRALRQANQGYVRARNNGVRMARGLLLSFLDHDDCWRPTKIERQMLRLMERPESAVVYTAVELIDENGKHLDTMPAPPREAAFRNTILMEGPILALEQGALIRRDAFVEVGGFDERLSTSNACNLACRLALAYAVEPVDEPLAAYRRHGQQMSRNQAALEHDMRFIHRELLAGNDRYRNLLGPARYNLHMLLARWYWQVQRHAVRAIWHAARAILSHPRHIAKRAVRLDFRVFRGR